MVLSMLEVVAELLGQVVTLEAVPELFPLQVVQVAEVEQVLRAKAPTAPVAIPEHLGHTKLVQVVVVVQVVKVEFLENHGVTDKVTATTVAETMELVVVDQVHHMVVDLEAKAQCVLFGQQLEDATHRAVLKIKDGEF